MGAMTILNERDPFARSVLWAVVQEASRVERDRLDYLASRVAERLGGAKPRRRGRSS